jgi:hypothetical protein
MNESKFWRVVAVAFVVALAYVGHGLHSPQGASLPSLENVVHAAGVSWHTDSPEMFTASADGQTVFAWKRFKDVKDGGVVVQYMGLTRALAVDNRQPNIDRGHPGMRAGRGFPGGPVPAPIDTKK